MDVKGEGEKGEEEKDDEAMAEGETVRRENE